MALERLTSEDARILALEAGTIRGHTCKVILADSSPGSPERPVDRLRDQLQERLSLVPRLRRRQARTPLGIADPVWVDDDRFDIARHVVAAPGGSAVDDTELRAIVGRLMAERLDPERPLWRVDVLEALEDGGIALVIRVHHCMPDGVATMRMLSQVLLDGESDPRTPALGSWRPEPAPSAASLLARGAADCLRAAAAPPAPRGRSPRRAPGATARGPSRACPRPSGASCPAPASPRRWQLPSARSARSPSCRPSCPT